MGGDACIFNAMQRTADPKVIRVLQSSWTITFVKIKRHISKFHGVWESPKCIIWIFTSKQYLYGLCRKNYFLLDLHTVILHLSVKRIPKILCGSISWNSVSVILLAICGFVSFIIIISSPSPRDAVFALMNVTEETSFFTPCSSSNDVSILSSKPSEASLKDGNLESLEKNLTKD